MTVLEVARRLRAVEAGEPMARYDTIHHAVATPEHTLLVAFVRMAGESRPWGIAWGQPGDAPAVRSVPDGRVRDDVAEIAADFGEVLLGHLRVHNWTYDPVPRDAKADDLRQVWLPNGQHVAILHQLEYAYAQTKFGGADRETLNALGRLAGWLFRESARRGTQHVVDASAALRDAYAFPAQDARQAHLGFLLAWLRTKGNGRDRAAAAELAERDPVSPTMAPSVDRDELAPLLEKRQSRRRADKDTAPLDDQVATILHRELHYRWKQLDHAYEVLRSSDRPVNPGVAGLVASAVEEFYWRVQAPELKIADPTQGSAYVPHPETDFHGSAAASNYLRFGAADERFVNLLIHDDESLFRESLRDGRAMQGTVLGVRDEGSGRSIVPIWVVELDVDAPRRIREGGRVVPRGGPGHYAVVRVLEQDERGVRVELEWQGRKTMPVPTGPHAKPVSDEWVGLEVGFVASDAADLTLRRSQRVWRAADGPGAWLTHGRRPTPIVADIANDEPETILDDITQIEGTVP